MAYSTLADLEKMIPAAILLQLTNDAGTGTIDQTVIAEAIASADAEINPYCGGLYVTPFTTVPPIVNKLSIDIAIYNLYSRKVEEIPKTRADRYANAISQLKMNAKGDIPLGLSPADDTKVSQDGAASNKTVDDRTFTKDNLGGF